MRRRRGSSGAWCYYCERELTPAGTEKGNSFTLDHVRPESQGGWRRVPCCRKCNLLKGDLDPSEWFWFIRAWPRWWKLFDTPAQVVVAVRDEYRRRSMARAAIVGV